LIVLDTKRWEDYKLDEIKYVKINQ
jgi:hypothetical protein